MNKNTKLHFLMARQRSWSSTGVRVCVDALLLLSRCPPQQNATQSPLCMARGTNVRLPCRLSVLRDLMRDDGADLVLSDAEDALCGGQVADTGSVEAAGGSFTVDDTRVAAGYVLHVGRAQVNLTIGESVTTKYAPSPAHRSPLNILPPQPFS